MQKIRGVYLTIPNSVGRDWEDLTLSLNNDRLSIEVNCVTNWGMDINEYYPKYCYEANSVYLAFTKIQTMFEANANQCQNFGLWPNATLYLFLKEVYGGKLITEHPSLIASKRPESLGRERIVSKANEYPSPSTDQCWRGRDLVVNVIESTITRYPDYLDSVRFFRFYSGLYNYYSGTSDSSLVNGYEPRSDFN